VAIDMFGDSWVMKQRLIGREWNDGGIGGRLDHGGALGMMEPPDVATKRKVAAVTQVSRPGFQEPSAHKVPCAQPP